VIFLILFSITIIVIRVVQKRPRTFLDWLPILPVLLACIFINVDTINFFHQKQRDFQAVQSAAEQQNPWNGTWVLEGSDTFNNAILSISNVTETSFSFVVQAQAGTHTGDWTNDPNAIDVSNSTPGMLVVKGAMATYTDVQPDGTDF